MVNNLISLALPAKKYIEQRDSNFEQLLQNSVKDALSLSLPSALFSSLIMLSEYHVNRALSGLSKYHYDEIDWNDYRISFEYLRVALTQFESSGSKMTPVILSKIFSLALWGRLTDRNDSFSLAKSLIPSDLSEFDKQVAELKYTDVLKLINSSYGDSEDLGLYSPLIEMSIERKTCESLINTHVRACKSSASSVPLFSLSAAAIPLDILRAKNLYPPLCIDGLVKIYDSLGSLGAYFENDLISELDIGIC